MAPSHYLNHWWPIVNWTLRNKLQWNFNRNSNILVDENASAMSAILSLTCNKCVISSCIFSSKTGRPTPNSRNIPCMNLRCSRHKGPWVPTIPENTYDYFIMTSWHGDAFGIIGSSCEGNHYNDVIMGAIAFSNHQPHDYLLNRLFRRRSKKISKLRVTGLCVGNSPVTGEFPAQMASNAKNVSIWWRHHAPVPLLD